MARSLRIEYEGAFYHVTARGNERRNIYYCKADYERFKQYLLEAKKKYNCRIHCYALMGNHYHLLIETLEANLNKIMHYINSSYTTYLNIRRKRSGHLFQGRYKAIVIDKDSYLTELSRYIHLNPVRAGMVERSEDYLYSSYKSYISGGKEEIISDDFILSQFSMDKGQARKKYKAFTENAIGVEMKDPMKKVYGGFILGRTEFIKETLRRLKRDYLQKEEISHRREIKASIGVEEVLEAICDYFKISRDEIYKDKTGSYKKIAIYLIKKNSWATNRKIGELFGGISYSAVSKIYRRFKETMEKDATIRKITGKIELKLSYAVLCQGLTPFYLFISSPLFIS